MSKALIMGDPRETDLRYRGLFLVAWNTSLAEIADITRQEDLPAGINTYTVGELVAGLTSVPTVAEGSEYDEYAPQPGKNWTVSTGLYKFAFRASEEMRKYGRSNQIAQWPQLMVDIFNQTLKVQTYNHYNRAFSSSFPSLYDGLELIATNHPLAGGGTASNELGTPADLSETTLEALIELMVKTPNEDGVFKGMTPRKLMVNTAQWGAATRLTGSTTTTLQGSGESGNAINAVTAAWNITPHFSAYLTDTDATYLLADRPPANIVFAADGRPALKPVYLDPKTDDWIWRAKGEWANVLDTWRGCAGSAGA